MFIQKKKRNHLQSFQKQQKNDYQTNHSSYNIRGCKTAKYVSGDTVILLIGGSRLFPCISVSCRVIPMDTHWYIVGKLRFNSMNHVGHVLNHNFNLTNAQWRRRCKIIITQKNTCLTSGSTLRLHMHCDAHIYLHVLSL